MTSKNATIFRESDINFHFNDKWHILKYDRHRFYSGLSGAGLKGTDFIGILDKKTLVLVEVKSYQDRYPPDNVNPTTEFLNNQNLLLQSYAEKFRDTLKGILIVQRYYRRKWWYRYVLMPFSRLSALENHLNSDWAFWTQAYRLAFNKGEKIQLVLWLSLDQEVETAMEFDVKAFHKKLEKVVQKEFTNDNWQLIVASERDNPYRESLQID